ncbi:DMT family transporter [Candidatus Chromulinivorax destructor]|uniref:EamA domain-containing protein n=1 Tax=Candidatus Chromulinivorax destructor TaxID=2066483 RepID=A0A345ZA67_9BACT|nr:DMT family transporter [Candidatus Chromulinivorax destructor]AXK60184.1 hypothetical protein C0J27_00265 [Candidatus Chromulinivorax destructor]
MYLVFFLYALLASTFSIGKLLLGVLPPIFLIAIRMIISGALLTSIWYFFYTDKKIRTADLWLFGMVVVFHILFPFMSEYIALQDMSPSSACLLYNLSPFFSALFSYFIFDEKMTPKKWIGFSIGLAGIVWYVGSQQAIDVNVSWANVLMLFSVITSSLGWIFVRLLVKNRGYSTMLVNGFAMLVGGLVALPVSSIFEGPVDISFSQLPYIAGLLTIMILITNVLFYNLYGYLLTKYTATFLSFVGFVTPLFSALFEWFFFGTMMSLNFICTVSVVGIGIFIFYQEELKQGYISR